MCSFITPLETILTEADRRCKSNHHLTFNFLTQTMRKYDIKHEICARIQCTDHNLSYEVPVLLAQKHRITQAILAIVL